MKRSPRAHHLNPRRHDKELEAGSAAASTRGLLIDADNPDLPPEVRDAASCRLQNLVNSGQVTPEALDLMRERLRFIELKNIRFKIISGASPAETGQADLDTEDPLIPILHTTGFEVTDTFEAEGLNFIEVKPSTSKIGKYENPHAKSRVQKSMSALSLKRLVRTPKYLAPRETFIDRTLNFASEKLNKHKRKFVYATLGLLAMSTGFKTLDLNNDAVATKPAAATAEPNHKLITVLSSDGYVESSSFSDIYDLSQQTLYSATKSVSHKLPEESITEPALTITIEKGSNIWEATKVALQETNPSISNPEISKVVNRLIVENNLDNPDLVYEGNIFTVSLNS